MKQYTTPTVKIVFKHINTEDIQHIDFVIKSRIARDEPPIAWRQYDANPQVFIPQGKKAEYNSEGDFFVITLTADETSHIKVDRKGRPTICFLDARIKRTDGSIPSTPIQKIRINPTLFFENYEQGGGVE